ncbi:hypothetical protein RCG23_13900 [Neobacillus sp. PS3-34]|uniref:hypothetical protein n=1 Tax=Neobacillus sp. PS3-34 TaxID=3070678 RepID=UPI0027DEB4EE|nr:hypothetical protein [Neobacillus sp. PS3-34]WML46735.1 hypothetical protein RCG23_13900 [Neobacillus sp. PS3-34]
MKRIIGMLMVFILLLSLMSACSEESQQTKTESQKSAQHKEGKHHVEKKVTGKALPKTRTATPASPNTNEPQVSVQVGLGDTYDAFTKAYGKNNGDKTMARFQNDYLLPMFLNHRADNITIQFESTSQPSRTVEEAKQVASQLIPKDAKLVKEYTKADIPCTVKEYRSESIARLFPDSEPMGPLL